MLVITYLHLQRISVHRCMPSCWWDRGWLWHSTGFSVPNLAACHLQIFWPHQPAV